MVSDTCNNVLYLSRTYLTEDGKKTSFGWGSVKDKFPNKNNSLIENPGKPYFYCKGFDKKEFTYIYRLTKGGSNE